MKKVVRFIQLEENRYVFTPISTQECIKRMRWRHWNLALMGVSTL
jgi:hypothetical protein